jgi:NAD(P)-dependent dehydrogenase (short-subunit alcohol dehydrogenase family)
VTLELRGRRVLITGAGSGIGRQSAFSFAEQGANLWLADIDGDAVERTALLCRKMGVEAHGRALDVADTGAMAALADDVHSEGGALDVLMNNAGVGVAGKLVETDPSVWDWAIGVNVKGVVHGCRFFIPAMIERGQGGHVVNTASAAGLVAPPGMSVYAATKFAVVGLSESLQAELADDRILVTTVCPGVVHTPIVRKARLTGSLAGRQGFTDQIENLYRRRGYGPERVAKAVLRAVREGRDGVLPVTPEAWAMYAAKRMAPGVMATLATKNRLI